jgi:dolichol kinase
MSAEERSSEEHRQIVHIAMGGMALLLRYINTWEAMILAGGAVAINLYALPRIAGILYRPGETRRRFTSGIVLYPLSVLMLLVAFGDRLDIVAAAWGVLAFGDGTATLVGRRIPSARIPWNREKTIAGSAAFVIFGGAAGAFLCWWCRPTVVPPPYLWFSLGMPWLAATVAAAVETIPIRLNDNLSVPASAGIVLWLTSLISDDLAIGAAQ